MANEILKEELLNEEQLWSEAHAVSFPATPNC